MGPRGPTVMLLSFSTYGLPEAVVSLRTCSCMAAPFMLHGVDAVCGGSRGAVVPDRLVGSCRVTGGRRGGRPVSGAGVRQANTTLPAALSSIKSIILME